MNIIIIIIIIIIVSVPHLFSSVARRVGRSDLCLCLWELAHALKATEILTRRWQQAPLEITDGVDCGHAHTLTLIKTRRDQ